MNNKNKSKNKLWLKTLGIMSVVLLMTTTLPVLENNMQEVDAAGEYIRTFNNTSTGQTGANSNNSSGTLGGSISMSGGMYLWTVPYTGVYEIDTHGAGGGLATGYAPSYPGRGANMVSTFNLTAGTVLKILVGQKGVDASHGGGGGGGTFVSTTANNPLIVAGGGGGAQQSTSNPSIVDASLTTTGKGFSGAANTLGGGGGGGFSINGQNGNGIGGASFINGGVGGANSNTMSGPGGFGGGGGAEWTQYGTGGGGGGYGGGGSGTFTSAGLAGYYLVGGGSSYSSGNMVSSGVGNTGHGLVIITSLNPTVTSITPPNGTSFQDSFVNLGWAVNTSGTLEYQVKAGKTSGGTDILGITSTNTTATHKLLIPAGTPGNTTIYVNVRARNSSGWGDWKEQTLLFANNMPSTTATFTTAQKDLSNSLDERTMDFSIDTVVDPDNFNYVKLYAEIQGVAGSKKQLGSNLTGPVSWTKKDYKLKVIPTFKATGSTYDLVVVDAANENTIYATLLDDRAMQAGGAAAPESFTFLIYAEDYQNSLNTKLSTSVYKTIGITIDTRNYLPRTFNVTHDINNRIMSANQGFNRVKVDGSVDELDPTDDINVYYTVKLASDKVAGKYVVNPATDTFIKKITSTGSGASGTFTATYTIQETLANGDYVLLVYGADSRNGIGDPVAMNFTVNKTNPDIRFYANYNGNVLATAERQILAKNSKLKMYFSAYDYTTFEYAGYIVRVGQQSDSGTYEDLKIRGAFTNDVPSQFIGVDLSDPLFNKGDMLVFKFRAISSTGVVIKKDVRVLIGDQVNTVADVADTKIPNTLLDK